MTSKHRAYARAGILGNPTDGYFGKTIAIIVKNFYAEISLQESEDLRIEEQKQDQNTFSSILELVERTSLYGYYGGIRLIKASIKKFYEFFAKQKIPLEDKNFTIQYKSNIPRQLGLGGSSAIITATMRALMEFYNVTIPIKILPSVILDVELVELGINAGFMDRVIQVYEGCVYMDLNKETIEKKGHGLYERLNQKLLPPLYIAYKPALGKVSGKVLNDIRMGYEKKDPAVLSTLERIAGIAEIGKQALEEGNLKRLHQLMDENFELRSRIMRISENNFELIRTARKCGASAKFAGSGGSIIGMYQGEKMFQNLKKEMEKLQAKVIKPLIE
jgi:glucuronokinase